METPRLHHLHSITVGECIFFASQMSRNEMWKNNQKFGRMSTRISFSTYLWVCTSHFSVVIHENFPTKTEDSRRIRLVVSTRLIWQRIPLPNWESNMNFWIWTTQISTSRIWIREKMCVGLKQMRNGLLFYFLLSFSTSRHIHRVLLFCCTPWGLQSSKKTFYRRSRISNMKKNDIAMLNWNWKW